MNVSWQLSEEPPASRVPRRAGNIVLSAFGSGLLAFGLLGFGFAFRGNAIQPITPQSAKAATAAKIAPPALIEINVPGPTAVEIAERLAVPPPPPPTVLQRKP